MSQPNATEIECGLFIGGETESLPANCTSYTLIVNCTQDLPFSPNVPDGARIRIPVKDIDDPNQQTIMADTLINTNILHTIFDTLQAGGRVLVHCRMGQQRSAAVIAAYIMYSRKVDIKDAIRTVTLLRACAFFGGHVNFMTALEAFSKSSNKL